MWYVEIKLGVVMDDNARDEGDSCGLQMIVEEVVESDGLSESAW